MDGGCQTSGKLKGKSRREWDASQAGTEREKWVERRKLSGQSTNLETRPFCRTECSAPRPQKDPILHDLICNLYSSPIQCSHLRPFLQPCHRRYFPLRGNTLVFSGEAHDSLEESHTPMYLHVLFPSFPWQQVRQLRNSPAPQQVRSSLNPNHRFSCLAPAFRACNRPTLDDRHVLEAGCRLCSCPIAQIRIIAFCCANGKRWCTASSVTSPWNFQSAVDARSNSCNDVPSS